MNLCLTLCAAKHLSSLSSALLAYSKASNVSCFLRSASMLGRRDRSRDALASLHRNSASSLDGHTFPVCDITDAVCINSFTLVPPGGRAQSTLLEVRTEISNKQCCVSPVLVLQQQLVEFLCLCTAVQVVCLLQDLLCTGTKHRNNTFSQKTVTQHFTILGSI